MDPFHVDDRWDQLAEILVEYSMEVSPGERVLISMGEVAAFPLANSLVRSIVRAGGLPQVIFTSEEMRHSIMRFGNLDQVAWVPELEVYGMEWADVYFGLRGGFDLSIHDGIQDQILALNQAAQGKVSTARWKQTRWMLLRIPNESYARQAGLKLDETIEMFFAACLQDWRKESEKLAGWAEQLKESDDVHILGEQTDLHFSIAGRTWKTKQATANMPDGEICTAPITESVDGHIYFEDPAVLGGRLVHDLYLEWSAGKLIRATSSTNQDFLKQVLETDEGASNIGEFAFGTNYSLTRFTKDILIDEKIGGTVHIALGRAYPECGGTNQSAIHWDIVKDIRKNGSVTVDGRKVLESGMYSF